MYRFLLFLAVVFVPLTLSWWLFIPLALLSIYLVGLPYELVVASLIFDSVYYFGDSFFKQHLLTLFTLLLIIITWFLSKRIYWRKII